MTLIFALTKSIEENKYNPNVMVIETRALLHMEMKAKGEKGFWNEGNRISVSAYHKFYGKHPAITTTKWVIIDGAQRYREAKILNWTEVAILDVDMTEEEAKAHTYKLSKIRGQIDPIKEMELFFSETKDGGASKPLTHSKIAEKYGVGRTFVSHLLRIGKLPDLVQKLALSPQQTYLELAYYLKDERPNHQEGSIVPTLTKSHLEVLASVAGNTERCINYAYETVDREWSVERLQREVSKWLAEIKAENDLQELKERSKMCVCPICEGPSVANADYTKLRCARNCYINQELVEWGPEDTKEEWLAMPVEVEHPSITSKVVVPKAEYAKAKEELLKIARAEDPEPETPEPEPTWFKTEITKQQIDDALGRLALDLIRNKFDTVFEVNVIGMIDGKPTQVYFDPDRSNALFTFKEIALPRPEIGYGEREKYGISWLGDHIHVNWPKQELDISYHDGKWKTGTMKSRVDTGANYSPESLGLIQKYLEEIVNGKLNPELVNMPLFNHGRTEKEAQAWIDSSEEIQALPRERNIKYS